jgi:hypothetical protein
MATARSSPASRPAERRAASAAKTIPTIKKKPANKTTKSKSRDEAHSQPPSREAMAGRVHSMVARELDAVERVLDVLAPEGAGDAERAARTLASLARTLRELSLMNNTGDEPEAAAADDDDDDIPRDLDEFRRELARRINAFVDERTGSGVPDGTDAERDCRAGA